MPVTSWYCDQRKYHARGDMYIHIHTVGARALCRGRSRFACWKPASPATQGEVLAFSLKNQKYVILHEYFQRSQQYVKNPNGIIFYCYNSLQRKSANALDFLNPCCNILETTVNFYVFDFRTICFAWAWWFFVGRAKISPLRWRPKSSHCHCQACRDPLRNLYIGIP